MPHRTSRRGDARVRIELIESSESPLVPEETVEVEPTVTLEGTEPETNLDAEPELSRQEHASAQRQRRRRRFKVARRLLIPVVLAALVTPVGISYAKAITRVGTDSMSVRTVDWLRDQGFNGLVNTIERWWYTENPPIAGGTPGRIKDRDLVSEATRPTITAGSTTTLPPVPIHLPAPTSNVVSTPAAPAQTGEGVWQPTGRTVGGVPAVYTTFVRPSATYSSYYTGLMWMDTQLLRAAYVPGLQEPGGGSNPWGSQVPDAERPNLVAAFNSGFKIAQARGGVYYLGQEVKPLRTGAASLVIKTDGTASVGVWGRDFVMGPDIASVRQNLELLVDGGQLNPELREEDTNVFGATLGNKVYVWRSGVGVDANGGLIYAGGPAHSVVSIARTLQAAGAVRAMELDINTDWVSAYTYVPSDPNNPASPIVGRKLHDSMSRNGDRYLVPGERDFFAFFAAPRFPVVTTTTTTTRPSSTTTRK